VRTLVGSWADRPGAGDFISNILLYLPLGVFGALVFADGVGAPWRIGIVFLLGASLSVSMELTQYYDEGRVTAASDAYSNAIGAFLGAVGGSLLGRDVRWPMLREISANRIPVLLLIAWAGYRLYPYVPTIDLHKYWNALKPVVLSPSLAAYPLFRHVSIWLTFGVLVEAICGTRRARILYPATMGAVLVAEIFIISTVLSVEQIAGAAIAFGLWLILLIPGRRARLGFTALLLCAYVVVERLEPFQFRAAAGSFGWIPFLSFMRGSIDIDVLSFFEKIFLYGSLVWLLGEIGLRIATAVGFVASCLLLTSIAETHLPGRSAEITDATMAVMVGVIFRLMGAASKATGEGARPAK
jgi:VanZ family protein